ncbi:MAG: hypothetical protein KKB20_09990 [Proteobacteria bacterium]|nr:hypothetical protein [Pseudomonadota bacterium]
MRFRIPALATLVIAAFLLASCSQVPKPTSYPVNFQKKMQAVHHWDVLAAELAVEIKRTLEENAYVGDTPVYVRTKEPSTFSKVFNPLLEAQLMKHGLRVSETGENALWVDYEILLVKHRSDRQASSRRVTPGVMGLAGAMIINIADLVSSKAEEAAGWAAVGSLELLNLIGVFDGQSASGSENPVSDYELVFLTKIIASNTVLARNSRIYYINDKDVWHYQPRTDTRLKSFSVTNTQ